MKSDVIYQNREMSNPNPLAPTEKTKPTDNSETPKIPSNPKVKWLIYLVIFIAFLLFISLIASLVKKTPLTSPNSKPTTSPDIILTPTSPPNIAIPTSYQDKFNQIDQDNQTDIKFDPPQIDPNIGQ